MTENEILSVTEFETSRQAWDFMVTQQNLRNDRIYSIPYNNTRVVQEKYKTPVEIDPNFKIPSFRVISDHLGEGVRGLQSMADGKMYDSKSEYYKAVKAAGCEVVGNDAPREHKAETRGDFVTAKEVADTIKRLGG